MGSMLISYIIQSSGSGVLNYLVLFGRLLRHIDLLPLKHNLKCSCVDGTYQSMAV
jgi:hypothetical protein